MVMVMATDRVRKAEERRRRTRPRRLGTTEAANFVLITIPRLGAVPPLVLSSTNVIRGRGILYVVGVVTTD